MSLLPTDRLLSPRRIAIALWLIGAAITLPGLYTSGAATRGPGPDLEVATRLAGMPLVVFYRHHGLHTIHLRWGMLVLLVGPPLTGIGVAVYRLWRLLGIWQVRPIRRSV